MTWHKKDPVMTRLVKALPAPVPSKKRDLYVALLDSVVGQQLSTKVADVIFARFIALFPDEYPDAQKILRMKDEKLRAVGLSAAKVKYIKEIAKHHLEHPISAKRFAKMTDDEVIADLTSIKGVGPWTAQMLMMFPMNRPDVFSVGDLVIRQVMIELYNVKETGAAQLRKLHEIADGWKPHRTMASKYLWKHRDNAKAQSKAVRLKKK